MQRLKCQRATANGAALTWDSFMAALNTFNHQQVGVYPSISYTPQDHTGATQSSIYQVQNGKFVQVLPMTAGFGANRSPSRLSMIAPLTNGGLSSELVLLIVIV